jgi:hypothetical protein
LHLLQYGAWQQGRLGFADLPDTAFSVVGTNGNRVRRDDTIVRCRLFNKPNLVRVDCHTCPGRRRACWRARTLLRCVFVHRLDRTALGSSLTWAVPAWWCAARSFDLIAHGGALCALQVDLGRCRWVLGVATQGRPVRTRAPLEPVVLFTLFIENWLLFHQDTGDQSSPDFVTSYSIEYVDVEDGKMRLAQPRPENAYMVSLRCDLVVLAPPRLARSRCTLDYWIVRDLTMMMLTLLLRGADLPRQEPPRDERPAAAAPAAVHTIPRQQWRKLGRGVPVRRADCCPLRRAEAADLD